MRNPVPDRFSLGKVATDYWRSLRIFKTNERDTWALAVLFGIPLAVSAGGILTKYVFPVPVALLPAVALLAGVLLAAAGQVITLRARIADSLVLSENARVRAHVRETMSGVLLAAIAALTDALLLGSLAAASALENYVVRWWHIGLSSAALAVTAYLVLMFVATARRLYDTYLEVFENGTPIPKPNEDAAPVIAQWNAERSSRSQ
ncbi:hypothetical protein [Rhodococcus erythropolis]|uniref:hypothetical protein n=1 Tax=Rhodococcus erythropolis TaxID=1833 RepID=UPI0036DEE131